MDQCLPHIHGLPKSYTNLESENLELTANRAILGPSPKVNNNDQGNNINATLHASAEALLLLNNARVGLAQTMENEKENESTFRPTHEIPITAPIPLSYSARGVEALRSILSIGEDLDEMTEPTGCEGVQQFGLQGENTFMENPRIYPTCHTGKGHRTFDNEKQQDISLKQAPLLFRPISPSTLMALTEPCLMAWCLDTEPTRGQELTSTQTTVPDLEYNPAFFVDGHINTSYIMEANTRNLWGY